MAGRKEQRGEQEGGADALHDLPMGGRVYGGESESREVTMKIINLYDQENSRICRFFHLTQKFTRRWSSCFCFDFGKPSRGRSFSHEPCCIASYSSSGGYRV